MARRVFVDTSPFTDCTSFVVMRELDLTEAITSDEHFRIAGFEILGRG